MVAETLIKAFPPLAIASGVFAVAAPAAAVDGTTVPVLGGLIAVLGLLAKHGGKIVAIFAKMEEHARVQADSMRSMSERMERVEAALIARNSSHVPAE